MMRGPAEARGPTVASDRRGLRGRDAQINAIELLLDELRATGEVVRHRDPETIWQLTPQELQIARLVAKGGSNRDAAAELFLSPRTVEYHLRKVFTKLGISSWTELVRMTLADELVGSDAGS